MEKRTRAVVLLSGGLDSAVALTIALHEQREVIALFIDYGQRCKREYEMFKKLVNFYGIDSKEGRIQAPIESELTDTTRSVSDHGVVGAGYVPCRNAMFLTMAFAVAESHQCEEVWIGTNWTARDSTGTPDATEGFLKSMELTMLLGSRAGLEGRPIRLVVPLCELNKLGVVRSGIDLSVPFAHTWSCRTEASSPCGRCDSCVERAKAFRDAGVKDPVTDRMGVVC
jgi:7-cyano-7-deazaguanine synthase